VISPKSPRNQRRRLALARAATRAHHSRGLITRGARCNREALLSFEGSRSDRSQPGPGARGLVGTDTRRVYLENCIVALGVLYISRY
jgi:hypothetical protein